MAEQQRPKTFNSPKGTASYPWLNKPDTKFKAAGQYSVRLVIPAEEAQAFVSFLDAQYDAGVAYELDVAFQKALVKTPKITFDKFKEKVKLADRPYTMVVDDGGEETGDVQVNFKANASYVDKKTGKVVPLNIRLFDAAGNATDVLIGGGSKLKVAFQVISFPPAAFGTGVSLRMQAVQVLEARTFQAGSGTGDQYGFGKEEGFVGTVSDSPFSTDHNESAGTESVDEGDANSDDPNF